MLFDKMKRTVAMAASVLFVMAAFHGSAIAQQAGYVEDLEPLYLINTPTAGVLKKGQYMLDVRAYGNSGVCGGIAIGLFDRFMFGLSYGGEQLLGYGDPIWNELPGVLVKYRLMEESNALPAITLGYDMQGRGTWYTADERYLIKSPGVFAAVSRNFKSPYGRFGIHGGANYNSFEDKDDSGVDFFTGMDLSLNPQLTLMAEYDFALDDNVKDGRFGDGPYGYLNIGVRLTFTQSLVIELEAMDLLGMGREAQGVGRTLRLVYVEDFTF